VSVLVRIPTPLRKLTDGLSEVALNGCNIGELLDSLENKFPGIKERLCDEQGNVRRFVNIYLNDEDVRFLSDLKTEIKDGDHVSIVPAIAGGARKKVSRKFYLTFPADVVKEPIIYWLGQKFKVITNIRGASVSEELGLVALELEGEPEEIERALTYLKRKKIEVEPIEKDIIE
jgi:molybdopterin synthase sulfur carrier subunit